MNNFKLIPTKYKCNNRRVYYWLSDMNSIRFAIASKRHRWHFYFPGINNPIGCELRNLTECKEIIELIGIINND